MELKYSADPISVPDVFIKVLDGESCLFYFRAKTSNLWEAPFSSYKVFPMMIDRSTNDQLADHQSGYIRVRMGLFKPNRPIPADWVAPTGRLQGTPVTIIANLFRGYELASADDDGMCDPFVEIDHYGRKAFSKTDPSTLDPIWNERIILESSTIEQSLLPVLINVFDSDPEGKQEFIGRAICELPTNITSRQDVNLVPYSSGWTELQLSEKVKIGKIRVSFQVLEGVPLAQLQRELRPLEFGKETYFLKMRLLGLRDLQSGGLLPVKKPYLKINITALQGEAATGNKLGVVTVNSKSGNENASLGEVLQ